MWVITYSPWQTYWTGRTFWGTIDDAVRFVRRDDAERALTFIASVYGRECTVVETWQEVARA